MIRTADMLYLAEEPASFANSAAAQLMRAGMVRYAVPMRQSNNVVMHYLSTSDADCILLVSPFQYADFMRDCRAALRALGKPIIAVVSEHTFGNLFQGYEMFHAEQQWADFYACMQDCDTRAFRERGYRAATFPAWCATDLFTAGPPLAERIQRACFVGHTHDYTPGMYAERRRILAALEGIVDVLQIPRAIHTAPRVAEAFASYAAVLCPPSNGRAHSIRCYEAAAAGALVVEVGQPLDEGNVWFEDGVHCIRMPAGMSEDDLRDAFVGRDYAPLQDIATRGRDLCRTLFRPEVVLRNIFDTASRQ
jgi:hypothetical protein